MVEAYLDNAATSRQKPAAVWKAMEEYFHGNNCNPGRSGYELALEAGRRVMAVREKLAAFFHVDDPHRVIFTQNITVALNFALKGLLQEGDHVLITGLEHNAVVRPLASLARERQISYSIIPTDPQGFLDLDAVPGMIRPNTRMVVATHASNVMGTLVPLEELGKIAREAGLDFVVDTAQTAGCLPLDMQKIGATVLAFTGHKHLLGPVGIGGFVLTEEAAARMKPLYEGGTGSVSDREEQPAFPPDRFESGTLNALGIVGLGGALDYLVQVGLDRIRAKEQALTRRLLEGLEEIPGVIIYGPKDAARQTGTVALNLREVDNAELAYVLDQKYRIMTRSGLHCAPVAHRTMGTFPEGVLRVSLGHFTTEEEVDYFLDALREIVRAIGL